VICEYGIELGLKVIFLRSLIGVIGKPDTMKHEGRCRACIAVVATNEDGSGNRAGVVALIRARRQMRSSRSSASRVVITLGLTLLAGSMEVLQLWVPGRHSAIIDAVFSSLGGLLGIALGGLLLVLATQAYKKHRHLGESAELVQ